MNSNVLIITQLLLEYALKMQEASQLLQKAALENRDITDDEVVQSKLRRDAALSLADAIDRA
jgi:hypothetical protein